MATLDGVRFQVETNKVKTMLATGRWPLAPNRRNRTGKNGARIASSRHHADEKLFALMRERPMAGVSQLARALGVSHSVLSRRIAKMKEGGLVARADDVMGDADEEG
jgi:DNA-binding transcriptional ArsR family regulator